MPKAKFITRPAAPFGPNSGGAIEAVVNSNTVLPVLDTASTIVPQIIGGRSMLSQYSQFLTPILGNEVTAGTTIAITQQHTEGPK